MESIALRDTSLKTEDDKNYAAYDITEKITVVAYTLCIGRYNGIILRICVGAQCQLFGMQFRVIC